MWHDVSPTQEPTQLRNFLAVGTIEPRKNLGTLLQAWSSARPAGAHLTVVGRAGWSSSKVTAELLRTPGVTWLNGVDDPDLAELYQAADVILSPSHYEGFGLSVLEGLAAGKIVACSDIPAHREIAEGVALFASPLDSQAWSQLLQRCATMPADEIVSRVRDGRRRSGDYSWDRFRSAVVHACSAASAHVERVRP
jgi:glycosyltransferase involved in cell wall biosynthesis